MTTKERAAAIRAAYKAKGWTARDISVRFDRFSMGSSIDVRIKNPDVNFEAAKQIAEDHESVSRCQISGEILSGGNRYVSVGYAAEAIEAIQARYETVLTTAARALHSDANDNSLHEIGSTGLLLGKDTNGHGYSLWGDGYLTGAWEVKHLATRLHTKLQEEGRV